MPNSALPGCSPKAARQRSAQRSDSRIAFSVDVVAGGQAHAFVELHLDVGAEQPLDLDRALGRQHMRRAVDVRLEGDAALVDAGAAAPAT